MRRYPRSARNLMRLRRVSGFSGVKPGKATNEVLVQNITTDWPLSILSKGCLTLILWSGGHRNRREHIRSSLEISLLDPSWCVTISYQCANLPKLIIE